MPYRFEYIHIYNLTPQRGKRNNEKKNLVFRKAQAPSDLCRASNSQQQPTKEKGEGIAQQPRVTENRRERKNESSSLIW